MWKCVAYCGSRRPLQVSTLTNWVCLWSVHSLSDVWRRSEPSISLVNLSRKSTLSQTCTHTHSDAHTQTTMQRQGVWDAPQSASCSHWMALVSQRTIWLLSGLATCVGSECLCDWLVASGFFFVCFVLFLGNVFYSRFLFSSSPPLWLLPFPLSPLLEWSAEGVLGTWLDAPLTALHLNSPTSSPQDPLCDTEAGDCGTCPRWHSITLMQDAHCFTVYRAATKNNKN